MLSVYQMMCPITATKMSQMVFLALTYFALKNGVLNCHLDVYEDFDESTENKKNKNCWLLIPCPNANYTLLIYLYMWQKTLKVLVTPQWQ